MGQTPRFDLCFRCIHCEIACFEGNGLLEIEIDIGSHITISWKNRGDNVLEIDRKLIDSTKLRSCVCRRG